jgi:Tol biopolymer transport system component
VKKSLSVLVIMLVTTSCFALKIESEKKVTTDGNWRYTRMAPDGTKFLAINGSRQIAVFKADGTVIGVKESTQMDFPVWSPDSKKIAAEMDTPNKPFVILNAEDLTGQYCGEHASDPQWEPDSKTLYYFFWKKDHGLAISKLYEWTVGASSPNEIMEVIKDKTSIKMPVTSPKGNGLVFMQTNLKPNIQLIVVDPGEGEKKVLAKNLKGETPYWSPDGKWIWTGAELVEFATKTVKSEGMPVASPVTWSQDSKMLLYSKEKKENDTVKDGDLAVFDITAGKEEVLKTAEYLESEASFSADGKKAVCVDAKDGNILIVNLK